MADFRDYIGMDASEFLMHYGKGHLQGGHSGRYPYGSTNNVKGGSSASAKKAIGQRAKGFLSGNNIIPYPNIRKLTDREKKAAELGLRALQKIGHGDIEDPTDPSEIDWLMWEDQTFGCLQVADMAAQGKSKNEIKLLLECASTKRQLIDELSYDDSRKEEYNKALKDLGNETETMFMLDEFNSQSAYGGNEYIDACLSLSKRKPLTEKRFNELKKTIEEYGEDMKEQAKLNYSESDLQETFELIDMECADRLEALEDEYKSGRK